VVRATAAATNSYFTSNVDATFTVSLAAQVVSWSVSTALTTTDSPKTPSVLASTSGSGAITYSVTSAGLTGCTVNSSTAVLTFTASGSCVVRATAATTSVYLTSYVDVTFTVTLAAPGVPSQPTGVAGNAQVTVTVSAGAGGTTASMTVRAVSDASKTCVVNGTSGSCVVTGLTNGTAYTFTAIATNATGSSSASTASASLTPTLTCAEGGTCIVGSTGPGGGKVFYAPGTTFAAAGLACNTAGVGGISTCRYLEVAPLSWSRETQTPAQTSCQQPATATADPKCSWSGIANGDVGGATRDGSIGAGYAATLAIIASSPTAGRAATAASGYRGGQKTDWYLPSFDELYQMCLVKSSVGGPVSGYFTSSTEVSSRYAEHVRFSDCRFGLPNNGYSKGDLMWVRPVRAFG
jgi:hypothetical protein